MKHGFIGAQDAIMLGVKHTTETQANAIKRAGRGALEAVVVMVKSGKNGYNLQGMNWMVSLGYIGAYTEELQAKGI